MVNQPIGNHGLGIFWFGYPRFDLEGPLLQDQVRIATVKSAYNPAHDWSYRFGMVPS